MSIYTKNHSKVIDQRSIVLPPTWASLRESTAQFEQMRSVLIADPKRHMANKIVQLIAAAKNMVVLCSFLLADDLIDLAIADAISRGVRVYLMLASETRLEREPEDDASEFDKKVHAHHNAMLKRLCGQVLLRSAPHFHAKVVLIDPSEDYAQGLLLTSNLTTEALTRNEEIGIVLKPQEVVTIASYLRWAFFEYADHELLETDHFKAVKPAGAVDYPKVQSSSVLTTNKHQQTIKLKLLTVITAAQTEIIISSFGWQEDHEVIKRLCEKAKTGVKVKILARIRPKTMPALILLRQAGAEVFGFKWLHAKAIWTDRNQAMIMSANIEEHGLEQGFELGIYTEDERVQEVKRVLDHWLAQSKWQLHLEPKLGDFLGKVKVFDKVSSGKSELIELDVTASKQNQLPPVRSTSFTLDVIEPNFPKGSWQSQPSHEVCFSWEQTAPVLAKNSKEQYLPNSKTSAGKSDKNEQSSTPYSPRVFKESTGKSVIAIRTPDEFESAKKLALQLKIERIVFLEEGM